MRQYSLVDQLIRRFDSKISSAFNKNSNKSKEENPLSNEISNKISNEISIGLMRVNHSGEVSAQALYQAQALVARNPALEYKLKTAAEEEQAHLTWCQERIVELGGKTSLLNPIWRCGSFVIGGIAGLAGDKISLGFVAETEHQVTAHLEKHLELLPKDDEKSREILTKMKEDELRHATNAMNDGGIKLPWFVRTLMKYTAKIMTFSSRYI